MSEKILGLEENIELLLEEGIKPENLKEEFLKRIPEAKEYEKEVKEAIDKVVKVSIILDHFSITNIHPALDFVDDNCYIGQFLPTKLKDEERENLCVINSSKDLFAVNEENLKSRKIALKYRPIKFETRFSPEMVKQFVNSDIQIEPVDLLNEIKEQLKLYIEFPIEQAYDFFSLWVVGTYFHPLFKSYPYVYVGGTKGTGKTKVLIFLSCLSFNAILSGNMSTASLFRLIQNARSTILIDETEKLSNPQKVEDFRNILLNGYKQGSKVYRTEKVVRERLEVIPFESYSPKALANIRGLEDVLEDRCISFIMKRTANKLIGEREIDFSDPIWQSIRDKLYVFLLTNWKNVKQTYESLQNDTSLSNRAWELWRPILALAKFFDEMTYKKMIGLAEMKTQEKITEDVTENAEMILVESLLELVDHSGYYRVSKIKEKMEEQYEDPKQEAWLTNKWVGNCLRRLGFTEKRRVGTGIEYKLDKESVKDIAVRLGIVKITTLDTLSSLSTQESSECSEYDEQNVGNISKAFKQVDNPEVAVCSYCGRYKTLLWKDSDGNYLCDGCKINEDMLH